MPAFSSIMPRAPESKSDSTISNPIYIAGIAVAGVLFLGATAWLSLHIIRKRSARKRQNNMGAAFFSVKGLVPDTPEDEKAGSNLQRSATQSKGFSRDNLDSTIPMPEKTLARPGQTREEILAFHRQSGAIPGPFAPKPFAFALNGGVPAQDSDQSPVSPASSRQRGSWMSFASRNVYDSSNRTSTMSYASSLDNVGSQRKIRQQFEPVLPDELTVAIGEQLTVVQSYDDGWCVVGRENSSFAHSAKSLFAKSAPANDNNVELGVVPAWCFLKPVKGLRAERPVRSSSLGITVNLDGPPSGPRNDLMSWSNF